MEKSCIKRAYRLTEKEYSVLQNISEQSVNGNFRFTDAGSSLNVTPSDAVRILAKLKRNNLIQYAKSGMFYTGFITMAGQYLLDHPEKVKVSKVI